METNRVVVDANVLYNAFVRDLLLSLFAARLYEAKWTDQINDEWIRNLLLNRTNTSPGAIDRTVRKMNGIKPCPLVRGYEHLIETLTLPDKDDRHVLAAAIASRSRGILTWNLKDFPERFLAPLGIEAECPDRFIASLIREDAPRVVQACREMRLRMQRPPIAVDKFLAMLIDSRLNATHGLLRCFRDQL